MVWYIPPLTPIIKAAGDKVYLPKSEAMRIPLKYLAEMFTAGDTEIIQRTLQKLLDMRLVMRQKEIGEPPPSNLEFELNEYVKMYRLLGIAKYADRIKLPTKIGGRIFLNIARRLRKFQIHKFVTPFAICSATLKVSARASTKICTYGRLIFRRIRICI